MHSSDVRRNTRASAVWATCDIRIEAALASVDGIGVTARAAVGSMHRVWLCTFAGHVLLPAAHRLLPREASDFVEVDTRGMHQSVS